MGWHEAIERTVTGLGYDLVDVERSARGLLRVSIDRVPGHAYAEALGQGEFVTIDDCELVTRQLQLSLEVDAVRPPTSWTARCPTRCVRRAWCP